MLTASTIWYSVITLKHATHLSGGNDTDLSSVVNSSVVKNYDTKQLSTPDHTSTRIRCKETKAIRPQCQRIHYVNQMRLRIRSHILQHVFVRLGLGITRRLLGITSARHFGMMRYDNINR